MSVIETLNRLEAGAVDVAAKIAPWPALVPTAYLVGDRTHRYLAWPVEVAGAAAVAVELLGVASGVTALEFWRYNRDRDPDRDPAAPTLIPALLTGLYLAVTEYLSVVLDIAGHEITAARLAPIAFPLLSLAAIGILAVRYGHGKRLAERAERLAEAAAAKAEANRQRRETRRQNAEAKRQQTATDRQQAATDRQQAASRAELTERELATLRHYAENGGGSQAAVAASLGISSRTVRLHLAKLEQAGLIERDRGRVMVLWAPTNEGEDGIDDD